MVINTNVSSLIAQRVLRGNNHNLNLSLERLSTGLRINRGKDDPAGLIASENLRSEIRAITAAIANGERADQVLNVAEGGMQEISNLLTDLQGLVTQAANEAGSGLAEKQAAQLQVDSILQTIDRIAGSTSFQGIKLLDGTHDARSTFVGPVTDWHVHSANFEGSSMSVNAIVAASAQLGGLFLSMGGGVLDLTSAGASFSLELGGEFGSRELTFSSGTSMANIAAAINGQKALTGVSAMVVNSGTSQGLKLISTEFGSDSFVSVKVVNSGGISTTDLGLYGMNANNFNALNTTRLASYADPSAKNGVRDEGQNVVATINGRVANADGKRIWVSGDNLDAEFVLTDAAAQTAGSYKLLDLAQGGAMFQLSPKVDLAGRVNISLPKIGINNLGNSTAGYLKSLVTGGTADLVKGDLTAAQKIVNTAVSEVSLARARLGAFQKYTVGTTVRSLGIALENSTAAESAIRDADFATESAGLTRSQILVQAATNVLGLANSQPQAVLSLLG